MRLPWPTTRSSSFPCGHQTPKLLQINKQTQTDWEKKMFLNITKEDRQKKKNQIEETKMFLNIRRKKTDRRKKTK
jgi:hypothetical protein